MALGHRSVREAQRWIDSREFAEWRAYDIIEPFGIPRDDLHAAIIAQAICAALGGKAKMKDFFPKFADPLKVDAEEMPAKNKQAGSQLLNWARAYNKRWAAKQKRERKT